MDISPGLLSWFSLLITYMFTRPSVELQYFYSDCSPFMITSDLYLESDHICSQTAQSDKNTLLATVSSAVHNQVKKGENSQSVFSFMSHGHKWLQTDLKWLNFCVHTVLNTRQNILFESLLPHNANLSYIVSLQTNWFNITYFLTSQKK